MNSKLDSIDEIIILGLILDEPEFMAIFIKKCHDPAFAIPQEDIQLFEALGFAKEGVIIQPVRRFVLNKLRIREDGVIEVKVISNNTKRRYSMSKIRCPKCGRTDCDHDARHLAEADEADYLAEKIYRQGKPVEELSDLELAEELIRDSGEDGYRRAIWNSHYDSALNS
ncbi:MAG: hypothetical protein UV67_C0027G0001 [Parcubacteria group bacterium GW2011_GWC1_43_12]|nr:MAG: hypothetical protein UV67_C0027G0001 [Parcubacteria group bacterium GW2011_GWC1_43_12]